MTYEIVGSSFVQKHLSSCSLLFFLFLLGYLTSNECLWKGLGILRYEEVYVVVYVYIASHSCCCLHHPLLVVQSLKKLIVHWLFYFVSFELKSLEFDGVAINLSRQLWLSIRQRSLSFVSKNSEMTFMVDSFSLFYWFRSSKEILTDNGFSIELTEVHFHFLFFLFAAEFFICIVCSHIWIMKLRNINCCSWRNWRFS